MAEIPSPRDTDSEDVVWGLQTADTLWKRGERIDALVWLRRAAQAAGDANDDDRALELARHAAELTEIMNAEIDSVAPDSAGVEEGVVLGDDLTDEDLLEDDLEDGQVEIEVGGESMPPPAVEASPRPSVPEASEVHAGLFDPWAEMSSKLPGPSAPPEEPAPPPQDEEVITSVRPNALMNPRSDAPPASARMPISQPPPALQPPTRADRPSFGMKAAVPPIPSATPPRPPPVPKKPALPKPSVPKMPAARPVSLPEENQARDAAAEPHQARDAAAEPHQARDAAAEPHQARDAAAEPPLVEMSVMPDEPSVAPQPPPIESTPVAEAIAEALERGLAESMGALKAAAEAQQPEIHAPEQAEEEASPPALEEEPAPAGAFEAPTYEDPMPEMDPESAPQLEAPVVAAAASVPPAPPSELGALDLENVEAFADMPDDVRATFAASAQIHELNDGEEIATFALAYVVKGVFEVAATMVDAAAGRLETGQVLRSRGTTEENVPIRMIAAGGKGAVATWSDVAVEEAFRTIPWVEDDLRAAADKMQTLVGITIGPLGERLDMSIREQIIGKLKMRPLIPSEIVVNKGETVPGLLLVGIGELELVKGDEVTGVVGSGEFLFPTEVLGMGDAPLTARAGKGGALVMFGDRGVAQELLVTCPPLLEVFAGM